MQEVSLEKVLKEGQILEAKFNEKQNWISATLYKAYDSILEIDIGTGEVPLDEYVAIGDSVNCRCTADDCEYLIQGWISRIKIDATQRVTIQIHKATKMEPVHDETSYDIFVGCIIRTDPKEKGVFSIAKKICGYDLTIGLKTGIELKEKMYIELLLSGNVTFRSAIEIESPSSWEGNKDFIAKISNPDTLNKRILENFMVELKNAGPQQSNQGSFWKKNSKIGS
ncbi:MAG: hypothetical protein ACM3UU_07165 [Ignavibacteriales bacterium]